MNKYIWILLAGSYIWYFGEGLLGPLYTVFAQDIGGDVLEITSAYALFLITSGTLSIFVGKISDGGYKKHLMMTGYALNALATFGYLFVDSPARLFLVQGVLGIASALATPTWDALFAAHMDKKEAGREWGFSDGGPEIIIGTAIIIGGVIVTLTSFKVLFISMGCIQIIAAIVQFQVYDVSRKLHKGRLKN